MERLNTDGILIKYSKVYCPYCENIHPVGLMMRRNLKQANGRYIRYNVFAYRCGETGRDFETQRMKEDNEARSEEILQRALRYSR